jgi:hypothetical protein
MRKTTLTSLLIVCGSTAALAQVATTPTEQAVQNSTGNAMRNEQAPPSDPMTNNAADVPSSNAMMNESNPKPM